MATTTWLVSCLELTTTTSSSTHHCDESVALSLFGMMKNSSIVFQSIVLRWHKSFFLSVNQREGRTLSFVLVMVGG
ncbi:sensor domain-containing diguanylate cyclase [Sesbania bispinosa]|nr:sensor domain-containing diguanylate cyclase [Sesbania bispinosa]